MEPNSAPHEILNGPLELYLAPVGTTPPEVDEEPAGPWALVATSGKRNYSEDGLTVNHDQTIEGFRSGGGTGKRKVWRTEEDLKFGVEIADMTLEAYKLALNGNTVESAAGVKRIGMTQGRNVTEYALVARGSSPYANNARAQYVVPRCYQAGSQEVTYEKGGPAMLQLEFEALEDDDAADESERFGWLEALEEEVT